MPENFIPLHTEVERIASGNITQGDVLDYQERKGLVSPYEVNPMRVTGNSYDDYELSVWNDFVGEFWNNSVVSAARGFANQIPISALADRLNPLQRSITPNERIAWAANLIGKEDAYRNSIVGKLLGNIESKYKKVGGYIVSDPLGLSSLNAAAGKVVGQEVRDDFFKNWIASVDKITESWKAPVTESKGFFKDPSGRSLVKGLGQGLGFMASVLVTKKAGASASMATSIAQMTPMYYDEAKAAGLTDEQAASFATALSPIIGATEYFGLEAVGKVAMKPALNALRKESVVAGAKAFTRVLEETGSGQKALNAAIKESNTVFGKSLKTIGVGMASGAAIEGGEEFGQTYIEEGYKQYFDKVVLPESKFGADVRSREALLKASEGAFFGGILGGLLAGGHGVFSAPSNQEVVEQSMFNIIDSSNNKEKALKGILSNVETAKAKGTISDKEYEGAKQMAQSLYEYVNSVPVSLNNTTAKYQAYKFISDRNLIAEQLQALDSRGTDPLLATADDDMRGFLEGVIGVYNEAIETIGKTKGQVSDAEIERRITELRNTYFQTAEDTAVETAETGIGEAVEAGDDGVAAVGADELNQGSQVETDVADTEDKQMVIKNNFGEIKSNDIQLANIEKENIDKQIATDENGNPIKIKINYDKLKNVLLNRGGKVLFRAMQGRFFTIAKVGNFYVPFYISSAGTSGKNEGEWYPFFGYNNWLVKGSVKNGKMAYSEKIDEVTKLLNENLQIPAKYFTQFGQIITGGTPVNPVKILYDINEDMPYESWFVDFDRKAGNTYTEEQFVADRTGLNPKMVVNNGGGSADSWINDIIALTEDSEIASKGVIKNQSEANKSKNEGVGEGVITPVQEIEVTVTPEVQLSEYEAIYERNQEKLNKLRKGKLKKGETRESRDMAIANLEQQEFMVKEKIDALRSQIASSVNVEPDNIAEEVRVETDVQSGVEQSEQVEAVGVVGESIYNNDGDLTDEGYGIVNKKLDDIVVYFADMYNLDVDKVRRAYNISKKGEYVSSAKNILNASVTNFEDVINLAKDLFPNSAEKIASEKYSILNNLEKGETNEISQEVSTAYSIIQEINSKYGKELSALKSTPQQTKTTQDATKIEGAESVDAGEPSRNGKKVGEGNTQKEEVAEAQEEKEVVSPTEQVEQPAEFEEVKQAKEKFYKHTEDKGYVEVKRAKPVYIFGTEKAFYVKEGKEFVVSDAITGAEIGRGSTLNNAVASAEENAGSVQNLESARERFTDAYGKSPYAKLQEEFSFTQSIINNAMDAAEDGIQDMTLDDMEDKGIIKRDCE